MSEHTLTDFDAGQLVADVKNMKETLQKIERWLDSDNDKRDAARRECQGRFEMKCEALDRRVSNVELSSGLNRMKLAGLIAGISMVISSAMAYLVHLVSEIFRP